MDNYGIKDMKNMIFPAWCWERSVRDYLLRVRVIVYGIGGRRGVMGEELCRGRAQEVEMGWMRPDNSPWLDLGGGLPG